MGFERYLGPVEICEHAAHNFRIPSCGSMLATASFISTREATRTPVPPSASTLPSSDNVEQRICWTASLNQSPAEIIRPTRQMKCATRLETSG
jgi:hypothetical protein